MRGVSRSVFKTPQVISKKAQDLHEVSIACRGSPMMRKGEGLGGKTSSLSRAKPKPL